MKLNVLYYWYDMNHKRKLEVYYSVIDRLKNWDKLKFGDLNAFQKHASNYISES